MKFTADRGRLVDVVTWAARATSAHPAAPVLSNVRLTARDTTVTVVGFDYDRSATAVTAATVDDDGECLLSARVLKGILEKLPDRPVDIIAPADGTTATVMAGAAVFTMPLTEVSYFPTLPPMGEVIGEVDEVAFREAIGQAAQCVAKKEALAELTGVLMDFDGDIVTLVGTDRYRLSVTRVPWKPVGVYEPFRIVAPPQVAADFVKASKEPVRLTLGRFGDDDAPSTLGLALPSRQATARLLTGSHVTYRDAIPPMDSPVVVTMDTDTLAAALERVAQVANETFANVALNIAPGAVTLSGGDDSRCSEQIEAGVEGEGMACVVNLRYLRDAVSKIGDEVTRVHLYSPTRPFMLTPGSGGVHWHMIMPIRKR